LRVREFFRGRSVFITGGTGFLGKALLRKLLAASGDSLGCVYLLLRPKRGREPAERLAALLADPIFECFRECGDEDGDGLSVLAKVRCVAGDVTAKELGLAADDRRRLEEEVSVVFHSAATVKFDAPMADSLSMNVDGTRRVLELAAAMSQLAAMVHVSTAYAHCNRPVIEERFYREEDLSDPKAVTSRPNTYTLTKAMAELCVGEYEKRLPLCVVRPSIVVAALKEPSRGWVDNLNGATGKAGKALCIQAAKVSRSLAGIIVGAGSGLLRTLYALDDKTADLIPVDVVVNALCAAAADAAHRGPGRARVFNVTSGETRPLTWGQVNEWCYPWVLEYPLETMIWCPGGSFKTNRAADRFARLYAQQIPARMVDVARAALGFKSFGLARICAKMERAADSLEYFTTRDWRWPGEETGRLLRALSAEDANVFDFSLESLDWFAFLGDYVLGARRYVLNQKPETLPACRRRLMFFRVAHFLLTVALPLFLLASLANYVCTSTL